MDRMVRAVSVLVALFASTTAAHAVEYAFVFHDGVEASVYDANTLTLLGRPAVGPNALQAVGAPDINNPATLKKVYVITQTSVVTLAPTPPFAVLGRTPLTVNVNLGRRSAQLSPDGRWLLLAAGEFLFAFDAQADGATPPVIVPMGGAPTGIGILQDGSRAFVSVEGSLNLAIVNLHTVPPQRLAGPVELPVIPLTVGAAPNAAGVYAVALGKVVAVDPYRNVIAGEIGLGPGTPFDVGFDREAPLDELFVANNTSFSVVNIDHFSLDFVANPPVSIKRAVSPRSDIFYLVSSASRQAFRSNRSGSSMGLLRDPRSNTAFSDPVVDLALNRAHSSVFVLFDQPGAIVRMSAAGDAVEKETTVSQTPNGIDLVGTPALVTTKLLVYGGNSQAGTAGEPLPRRISVKATNDEGLGVAHQDVTFTSFTSGAAINPARARTNLFGEASVEVSPLATSEFSVEARTPNGLTARFDLNTPQQGATGLEAISGDYQIQLVGKAFPLPTTIRTATFGVPDVENKLTITPRDADVSCPANVATGQDGSATFQCTAVSSISPFPKITRVDVVDDFGRTLPQPLTFSVVTDDRTMTAEPLEETFGEIVVPAGGRLENAVKVRLIQKSGLDSSRNVGVEFETTGPGLSFDPRIAPSSVFDGRVAAAAIGSCRLGRGMITTTMNSPDKFENEFLYRIVTGPAAAIARFQGIGQTGDANQRLNGPGQALVARVTDVCGNPVANEAITFTVSPPGALVLESVSPRTNGNGQASAIAVLGSRPGLAAVTVTTAGGLTTTFDLTINVTATKLVPVSGDAQRIAAGQPSQMRLVAALQNDLGAGAAGVPVTFSVVEGQGSFASPAETVTDETGRASVSVIGGPGLGRLVVEARALTFSTRFTLEVIGRTPIVPALGFVNAASFVSGLVPCGAASIFGVGLMEGVDGVVLPQGPPFPTRLRGVRVLVDGVEAPIMALVSRNGQEQINIQVPCFTKAPSTEVVVTIENNGVSATFAGVRTFAAQPGVYPITLPSGTFAAALHLDGTLVTPSNPARPGEIIQLFWNGGGALTPAIGTNVAAPLNPLSFVDVGVAVRLDGALTEVLASVYAPNFLTLYQTNFRVPANARTGLLPLRMEQGGQTSIEVSLPVGP